MHEHRSEPDLYPNETLEGLRAFVLRCRELRPIEKVERHIGPFCDGVDCCRRRRLCGTDPGTADVWRDHDPRANALIWHVELVLRFPKAFVDEPFCENCLRALALSQTGRSHEQLIQAELAGPDPDTLTWRDLPRGRKRHEQTWDDIRRGWPTLA